MARDSRGGGDKVKHKPRPRNKRAHKRTYKDAPKNPYWGKA